MTPKEIFIIKLRAGFYGQLSPRQNFFDSSKLLDTGLLPVNLR